MTMATAFDEDGQIPPGSGEEDEHRMWSVVSPAMVAVGEREEECLLEVGGGTPEKAVDGLACC